VERLEILLYERHADGRYTLNGVATRTFG